MTLMLVLAVLSLAVTLALPELNPDMAVLPNHRYPRLYCAPSLYVLVHVAVILKLVLAVAAGR